MNDEQLMEKLRNDDDCRQYVDRQGVPFEPPWCTGFSYEPMLQRLWGMPLCNAVLAHVTGLRPSALRIVFGEETTDGWCNRVTIHAFEDDHGVIRVRDIYQEVLVGYGCGYDVNQITSEIQDGKADGPLSSEITGFAHTGAIRRAEI